MSIVVAHQQEFRRNLTEKNDSDHISEVFFYNPESFDPTQHLPPELHRFSDEVRWLVHILYLRRILDRRQPDAFIPLKAAYLRRVLPFRQYTGIITALEYSGILEIDKQYIKGEKSRGYRLRADLMGEIHRRYRLENPNLVGKLADLKRELGKSISLDVHRHLLKNLQRVEIDDAIYDPRPEVCHQADAIRDQNWHFTVCKYGRVHTNLTSLASSLRSSLFVDGQRLVNLDIRNSQPLILSVVLLNYFLNGECLSSLHGFNLDNHQDSYCLDIIQGYFNKPTKSQLRPNNTDMKSNPAPTPLRCATFSLLVQSLEIPEDVKRYISLTEAGDLYDHLMREWNIPSTQRQEFKGEFFGKVLFCKDHTRYPEGRRFEEQFPNVMQAVKDLKRRDYTQAATLMQRVESSLMINRVVRRMMEKYPDAFVATIHDSILTTPDYADDVQGIMRHEFARVGLNPTIQRECLLKARFEQMAG